MLCGILQFSRRVILHMVYYTIIRQHYITPISHHNLPAFCGVGPLEQLAILPMKFDEKILYFDCITYIVCFFFCGVSCVFGLPQETQRVVNDAILIQKGLMHFEVSVCYSSLVITVYP